jgi:inorganic triphosphatase YgiF
LTSSPTSKAPREVELALAIAPDAVGALMRHPSVAAAKRGRTRSSRLVSDYFDTADDALASAGVALRVRRDGRRYVQTLKGPAEAASTPALRARAEHEWPLARRAIDWNALDATPWRRLLRRAAHDGVAPRFTTDFVRRTTLLAIAKDTRALLCVDRGAIRARGRQDAPISEVEIELVDGDPKALYAFARELASDVAVSILPTSKAERGFALADGMRHPAGPVHARDIVIAPDATALAALAAIAQDCARQVAMNGAGAHRHDHPEWVHQMRIGTRRLRACLQLIVHVDPRAPVTKIAKPLKRLAGVLGRVRDLDVFATEMLPAFETAPDGDARVAIAELARRIARKRTAARAALREALASPAYTRLVLDVGALIDRLVSSDSTRPARDAARTLLARRDRKLRRRIAKLGGGGDDDERHAARIAAKKLRYAPEFFAPLFPHGATRSYRRALAELQRVLGIANDAVVAIRLAESSGPARAVAAVRARVSSQQREQRSALRKASKRFERTERPWRHDAKR